MLQPVEVGTKFTPYGKIPSVILTVGEYPCVVQSIAFVSLA